MTLSGHCLMYFFVMSVWEEEEEEEGGEDNIYDNNKKTKKNRRRRRSRRRTTGSKHVNFRFIICSACIRTRRRYICLYTWYSQEMQVVSELCRQGSVMRYTNRNVNPGTKMMIIEVVVLEVVATLFAGHFIPGTQMTRIVIGSKLLFWRFFSRFKREKNSQVLGLMCHVDIGYGMSQIFFGPENPLVSSSNPFAFLLRSCTKEEHELKKAWKFQRNLRNMFRPLNYVLGLLG